MLRCGRAFSAILVLLALAACSAGETTEDATNSLPVRIDRAVSSFLGGNVPPPPPVVETPPRLPNERRPNLGDTPPRPVASPAADRSRALAELAQQRADAQAQDRLLAAGSPFAPDAQGAPGAPGGAPAAPGGPPAPGVQPAPASQPQPQPPPPQATLQQAPAIAIGAGRSLASVVFDTNSAILGAEQRQAVRAAAAQLGGRTGAVRVIGFAGAGLPPQEAAALARARADAVAAELRAAGVAAGRIQVQAPGNGSGRQVEIVVDL